MPNPIHPSCCAVTATLTEALGPFPCPVFLALHSIRKPPGSCKHASNALLSPVGSCSRQEVSRGGMPVAGSAGIVMSEGGREEREVRVLEGQPFSAVKG